MDSHVKSTKDLTAWQIRESVFAGKFTKVEACHKASSATQLGPFERVYHNKERMLPIHCIYVDKWRVCT